MPYYPQSPEFNPLPDQVTDAMLSNMPDGTVKGREIGAGAGDPTNIGRALSFRNLMYRNGGFEVWQRTGQADMTVPIGSETYTADGWALTVQQPHLIGPRDGSMLGSRQCAVLIRPEGTPGVQQIWFEYPFDTDEIAPMWGKKVMLSFSAYTGNTFATTTGLDATLIVGTGPPAKRLLTPYTDETYPLGGVVTPTTTPTRFFVPGGPVIPVSTTAATLVLRWTPAGTAGAQDWLYLDNFQLEIGTQATPFERRPFEQELLACRRHYYKTFRYEVAPAQAAGDLENGYNFPQVVPASTIQYGISSRFSVPMRVAPTMTFYNPNLANNQIINSNTNVAWGLIGAAAGANTFYMSSMSPVGTAVGHHSIVHFTADAGI